MAPPDDKGIGRSEPANGPSASHGPRPPRVVLEYVNPRHLHRSPWMPLMVLSCFLAIPALMFGTLLAWYFALSLLGMAANGGYHRHSWGGYVTGNLLAISLIVFPAWWLVRMLRVTGDD